ncbi:MAG: hypothetical protein PUH34_11355 [Eubacteriales bacterium]|nr:hypothetical protein [Eubacteriales bacterium]
MAERRMFARSIIGSARFLRMPPSSRLLYYDLGMEADDDGCVEAFAVMRKTGAAEDDLRVLASKGFLKVLNDDLVSVILDWKTNNYIQKDRYHPSIYAKLLNNPPLDTECIHDVSNMDTQVRLGKVSIGKSVEAALPPTRPRFSPPSVEDVAAFCQEKGYMIDPERFVDYYSSNGWKVGKNPMRDWKAAVRAWSRRDSPKPATTEPKNCGYVLAPPEDPWEAAMRKQQEAGRV